ncbi:MAG: response regulator [Candidatus Omnitrophica bacterium]|nr:response regulator [Candidatus Omnitrophota bacterium]
MNDILVVDDEELLRRMIVDHFRDKGYPVREAEDGVKAIDACRQEKPGIVLLDLNLPDMDGLAVLAEVKKLYPDLVVLIFSGLTDEIRAKEAIRLGAYEYLVKPLSLMELENNFIRLILGDP